jgi:membrane-bound serine protease (ClpP class)
VSAALLHLSPDAALVLLTAGVLLVYIELNRPGSIIPGAVGLICLLLSVAVFARAPYNPGAVTLIFAVIVVFLRGLRRDTHTVFYAFVTLCLAIGFLYLIPATEVAHVGPWSALPCAILLGFSTAILTRIAHRARRNKGLD